MHSPLITAISSPLGGTLYHVGTQRPFCIDAGHPKDRAQLLKRLDRRGLLSAIDYIFYTHGHPDHLGACAELRKASKAAIAGYPIAKNPRLTPQLIRELGVKVHRFKVDHHLKDNQRIDMGDDTLLVLHTPGHSPDHCAYFLEKARVLFAGDLIAYGELSVVDMNTLPQQGLDQLEASLKRCQQYNPRLILPGHGEPLQGGEALFKSLYKKVGLYRRHPRLLSSHLLISPLIYYLGTRKKTSILQIRKFTLRHFHLFKDMFPGGITPDGLIEELYRIFIVLELGETIGKDAKNVWLRKRNWNEKEFFKPRATL